MKEFLITNWEVIVIIFPIILYSFLSIFLKLFLRKNLAQRLTIDLSSLFFVIATNVAVEYYYGYEISAYSWLLLILIMTIVGIKSYRNKNEVYYSGVVKISLRLTFIIYAVLYLFVNISGIFTKLT